MMLLASFLTLSCVFAAEAFIQSFEALVRSSAVSVDLGPVHKKLSPEITKDAEEVGKVYEMIKRHVVTGGPAADHAIALYYYLKKSGAPTTEEEPALLQPLLWALEAKETFDEEELAETFMKGEPVEYCAITCSVVWALDGMTGHAPAQKKIELKPLIELSRSLQLLKDTKKALEDVNNLMKAAEKEQFEQDHPPVEEVPNATFESLPDYLQQEWAEIEEAMSASFPPKFMAARKQDFIQIHAEGAAMDQPVFSYRTREYSAPRIIGALQHMQLCQELPKNGSLLTWIGPKTKPVLLEFISTKHLEVVDVNMYGRVGLMARFVRSVLARETKVKRASCVSFTGVPIARFSPIFWQKSAELVLDGGEHWDTKMLVKEMLEPFADTSPHIEKPQIYMASKSGDRGMMGALHAYLAAKTGDAWSEYKFLLEYSVAKQDWSRGLLDLRKAYCVKLAGKARKHVMRCISRQACGTLLAWGNAGVVGKIESALRSIISETGEERGGMEESRPFEQYELTPVSLREHLASAFRDMSVLLQSPNASSESPPNYPVLPLFKGGSEIISYLAGIRGLVRGIREVPMRHQKSFLDQVVWAILELPLPSDDLLRSNSLEVFEGFGDEFFELIQDVASGTPAYHLYTVYLKLMTYTWYIATKQHEELRNILFDMRAVLKLHRRRPEQQLNLDAEIETKMDEIADFFGPSSGKLFFPFTSGSRIVVQSSSSSFGCQEYTQYYIKNLMTAEEREEILRLGREEYERNKNSRFDGDAWIVAHLLANPPSPALKGLLRLFQQFRQLGTFLRLPKGYFAEINSTPIVGLEIFGSTGAFAAGTPNENRFIAMNKPDQTDLFEFQATVIGPDRALATLHYVSRCSLDYESGRIRYLVQKTLLGTADMWPLLHRGLPLAGHVLKVLEDSFEAYDNALASASKKGKYSMVRAMMFLRLAQVKIALMSKSDTTALKASVDEALIRGSYSLRPGEQVLLFCKFLLTAHEAPTKDLVELVEKIHMLSVKLTVVWLEEEDLDLLRFKMIRRARDIRAYFSDENMARRHVSGLFFGSFDLGKEDDIAASDFPIGSFSYAGFQYEYNLLTMDIFKGDLRFGNSMREIRKLHFWPLVEALPYTRLSYNFKGEFDGAFSYEENARWSLLAVPRVDGQYRVTKRLGDEEWVLAPGFLQEILGAGNVLWMQQDRGQIQDVHSGALLAEIDFAGETFTFTRRSGLQSNSCTSWHMASVPVSMKHQFAALRPELRGGTLLGQSCADPGSDVQRLIFSKLSEQPEQEEEETGALLILESRKEDEKTRWVLADKPSLRVVHEQAISCWPWATGAMVLSDAEGKVSLLVPLDKDEWEEKRVFEIVPVERNALYLGEGGDESQWKLAPNRRIQNIYLAYALMRRPNACRKAKSKLLKEAMRLLGLVDTIDRLKDSELKVLWWIFYDKDAGPDEDPRVSAVRVRALWIVHENYRVHPYSVPNVEKGELKKANPLWPRIAWSYAMFLVDGIEDSEITDGLTKKYQYLMEYYKNANKLPPAFRLHASASSMPLAGLWSVAQEKDFLDLHLPQGVNLQKVPSKALRYLSTRYDMLIDKSSVAHYAKKSTASSASVSLEAFGTVPNMNVNFSALLKSLLQDPKRITVAASCLLRHALTLDRSGAEFGDLCKVVRLLGAVTAEEVSGPLPLIKAALAEDDDPTWGEVKAIARQLESGGTEADRQTAIAQRSAEYKRLAEQAGEWTASATRELPNEGIECNDPMPLKFAAIEELVIPLEKVSSPADLDANINVVKAAIGNIQEKIKSHFFAETGTTLQMLQLRLAKLSLDKSESGLDLVALAQAWTRQDGRFYLAAWPWLPRDKEYLQTLHNLVGTCMLQFTVYQALSRAKNYEGDEQMAELRQGRPYDISEMPYFLAFEFFDNLTIRSTHIDDTRILLERDASDEGVFKNVVLQRMMASGKTFVLAPVISMAKADGTWLPVTIPPASLFAVDSRAIFSRTLRLFNQRPVLISFERTEFHLEEPYLKYILSSLKDAIERRQYLLVAPQTPQALRARFIECLKAKRGIEADLLREILHLLRTSGVATLDEIDMTDTPFQEFNYPLEPRVGLEPIAAKFILEAWEFMATDAEVAPLLRLKSNQQRLFLGYEVSVKPKLVELACKHFEGLDLDVKRFLSYAVNKTQMIDEGMKQLREELRAIKSPENEELLRSLVFVRDFIHTWAPAALKQEVNLQFGRAPPSHPYEYAMPYSAAKAPKFGNEFASLCEILNKTCMLVVHEGLSLVQLQRYIRALQEKAAEEWKGSGGILDYNATPTGLEFYNAVNSPDSQKIYLLNEVDTSDEAELKVISSALQSGRPETLRFLLNFVRTDLLPSLKSAASQIFNNPQTLDSTFRSVQGFSGTVKLPFIFADRIPEPVEQDDTNKQVSGALKKRGTGLSILTKTQGSIAEVIEAIMRSLPEEARADAHAIIDLGAFFKAFTNVQVARGLVAYYKKRPEANIRSILYYDDKTRRAAFLSTTSSNEEDDTGRLLSGTSEPTIRAETGSPLAKIFAYYDHSHTTGADIPHVKEAFGIVMLGRDFVTRDLQQAVMRMRKLRESQSIHFVASEDLAISLEEENSFEKVLNYRTIHLDQEELMEVGDDDGLITDIFVRALNILQTPYVSGVQEENMAVSQENSALKVSLKEKVNDLDRDMPSAIKLRAEEVVKALGSISQLEIYFEAPSGEYIIELKSNEAALTVALKKRVNTFDRNDLEEYLKMAENNAAQMAHRQIDAVVIQKSLGILQTQLQDLVLLKLPARESAKVFRAFEWLFIRKTLIDPIAGFLSETERIPADTALKRQCRAFLQMFESSMEIFEDDTRINALLNEAKQKAEKQMMTLRKKLPNPKRQVASAVEGAEQEIGGTSPDCEQIQEELAEVQTQVDVQLEQKIENNQIRAVPTVTSREHNWMPSIFYASAINQKDFSYFRLDGSTVPKTQGIFDDNRLGRPEYLGIFSPQVMLSIELIRMDTLHVLDEHRKLPIVVSIIPLMSVKSATADPVVVASTVFEAQQYQRMDRHGTARLVEPITLTPSVLTPADYAIPEEVKGYILQVLFFSGHWKVITEEPWKHKFCEWIGELRQRDRLEAARIFFLDNNVRLLRPVMRKEAFSAVCKRVINVYVKLEESTQLLPGDEVKMSELEEVVEEMYVVLDLENQIESEKLLDSISKPGLAFTNPTDGQQRLLTCADGVTFECETVETLGTDMYVLQANDQMHLIDSGCERILLHQVARVDSSQR